MNSEAGYWKVTPLEGAAEYGHLDIVKYLMESHKGALSPEKALYSAALKGRMDVVKYFMEKGGSVTGTEVLDFIARRGDIGMLKYVIEKNASADLQKEMQNAIVAAIDTWPKSNSKQLEVIQYLASRLGGMDVHSKYARDAFIRAARYDKDIVQYFLDEGIDPNITNGYETAHGNAVDAGSFEIMKLLIKYGADVNQSTGNSMPLMDAARNADLPMIKYLVEQGAAINIATYYGEQTALGEAVKEGAYAAARYLLEQFPNSPEKVSNIRKMLNSLEEWEIKENIFLYIQANYPELTEGIEMRLSLDLPWLQNKEDARALMLPKSSYELRDEDITRLKTFTNKISLPWDVRAEVNSIISNAIAEDNYHTFTNTLVQISSLEILEYINGNDYSIPVQVLAAQLGKPKLLEFFFKLGYSMDSSSVPSMPYPSGYNGWYPIEAAANGHREIVTQLLEWNPKFRGSRTLFWALVSNQTEMITYFTNAGWDITEPMRDVLRHAVSKDDRALAETMLKQGISPNESGLLGNAISQKSYPMLDLLSRYGADFNLYQNTPPMFYILYPPKSEEVLLESIDSGQIQKMLAYLVRKGADISAVDSKGENLFFDLSRNIDSQSPQNRIGLVKWLMGMGVDIYAKSSAGVSALDMLMAHF